MLKYVFFTAAASSSSFATTCVMLCLGGKKLEIDINEHA
jgi:hypothetical protein